MTWFLGYMIFVGLILAGGYLLVARAMGQKAASRNMGHVLPWLFVGFAIAFATSLTGPWRQSAWSVFYLLYIVSMGIWLLRWPLRKRRAGGLLLNAGRTWHNKILLWVGMAEVPIAVIMTWISFAAMTNSVYASTTVAQFFLKAAFWWMIAGSIISLGLNKLELREHGLCFFYNVILWQRMKFYTWGTTHPNTLTIYIQPRFAFLPDSMSIRVPGVHRDTIDQIVQTHVPYSPPDSLVPS